MTSEAESRARAWMGTALACLLAGAILMLWAPELWKVSLVQVGIFLLAILWLAGVMVYGFPVRRHLLLIPLAGAVLWGCLQLAASQTVYRWATENAVLDWFTRLTVFFLALQFYDDDEVRRRILRALLWFGFALSILASLQRFSAPGKIYWLFETDIDGVMGPFVYYNQYAAFVETILPIAVLAALERRGRSWLYPVMAGVMIASVAAATSRAGAAMVAGVTVLVLVLGRKRARLPWRSMVAVAGATAAFVLLFAASMGWEPLWRKLHRADPYGERRELSYSTLEMARDRPWMGFGLGTWSTAYPAYATFDDGLFENQAHNDWAQWAAEGGVPFLLLMLMMAGGLLRPALRTVWGVGLLAVLVHCLVDYHFQQRPCFGYYYFALAGLLSAAGRGANSRGLEFEAD